MNLCDPASDGHRLTLMSTSAAIFSFSFSFSFSFPGSRILDSLDAHADSLDLATSLTFTEHPSVGVVAWPVLRKVGSHLRPVRFGLWARLSQPFGIHFGE